MSKKQSRRTVTKTLISLSLGLIVLISATVAQGSGLSFFDSVKEFFGIQTVETVATHPESAETSSSEAVEPMFFLTQLVKWDLSGLPGGTNNFGTSPLTPTASDSNVTIGGLTRGSGISTTGTGASKGWGGTGFSTTANTAALAVAANNFATFTITAAAGKKVSLDNIAAYNIRRSGTGPTTGLWQYQINSGSFVDIGSSITWGSTTTATGNAQSAISLASISALQNVPAGSTITLRVVMWGASASGGTWYFNDQTSGGSDLIVNGTVDPITYQLDVSKSGTGSGTVTSGDGGINCGTTCSSSYSSGTAVTLSASASSDSTFTGWSGACTGAGSCQVTMDQARSVTATFTKNTYQLSISKAGTGGGGVTSNVGGISCGATCSATYDSGTVVTLTASANAFSTFSGWSGACSGSTPNCQVTMDAAKSVTATFTRNQFTLDVTRSGSGTGSVSSNPAGIACGAGGACSAQFDAPTVVSLTATADQGSAFTGWSGACTGSGSCDVTMDSAKSVTATFTLRPSVSSTSPADGATVVALSSPVSVTFSRAIDVSSATTNSVDGACTGSVQVSKDSFQTCVGLFDPSTSDSTTLIWSPRSNLDASSTYRIRVTTGVHDQAGVALDAVYTQPNGFTTQSGQSTPTLSFTSTNPGTLAYLHTYTPTATTNSDGALSFTAGPPSTCSITNGVVRMDSGTGTCTVTAQTAATALYTAASVTQDITAAKGTQTLNFISSPPSSLAFGRTAQLDVTASPGGVAISFAATGGACDVSSSGLVTMTSGSVGTCTVTASTAATTNYEESSIQCSISPIRESPTLQFTSPPSSLAYGKTATLTVSGTPGGSTRSFAATGGACTVHPSSGEVLMTSGSVGTCTVTVSTTETDDFEASSAQVSISPIRESPTLQITNAAELSSPTYLGAPYSVSFTVTNQGAATTGVLKPSGTARVMSDGSVMCTAELSDGSASCSITPQAPAGTHHLVVSYLGDENYSPASSSPPVDHVVLEASHDASLSSLEVSTGTLEPTFRPTFFSYTLWVSNTTPDITVRPTCSSSTCSSITVNGTPVSSGADSPPVSLSVGTNQIFVRVVAQDGTTDGTYTITVTRAAPSLVIQSNTILPGGTYQDVSFGGCFTATMEGDVTITGTMTVSACSTLDTNQHIVFGSGSFVLQAGGAMTIGDPNGLTKPGSPVTCPNGQCGTVQTATRVYSTAGDYAYNGFTDQVVGDGLPETVHDLFVIAPPSATVPTRLDGYSPQVVTGKIKALGANGEGRKEYTGHVTLLKRPASPNTPCTEIDTYHDVEIGAGGKITLGCDVIVTGDWTMASGGQLSGDYAVTFNGSTGDQHITGDTTFYKLQSGFIYATSPAPQALRVHGMMTVSNQLIMHGGAADMLTVSGVDTSGTGVPSPWQLCALGSRSVDYVSMSDSDATCSGAPVSASHSTDGGGNTNWAFEQYQLSVSKSGNGGGLITSQPAGIDCGTACSSSFAFRTVVTLSVTPDQNSDFAGWSGDCSGTAECTVTMDQARSVTATITPKKRTLTITASAGGMVTSSPSGIDCGQTCSHDFDHGTVVTLTATPEQGYTFGGWTGDCSGTGTCVVTMDGAKSVGALWPHMHQVAVHKSGTGSGLVTSLPQGIDCGTACTSSFAEGSVVRLTAAPNSGSTFTGWSGDCTGTGQCILPMSGPKDVTATFTAGPPDHVVSSNETLPGGTYHDITFSGCFTATMSGDVTVTGSMTVSSCSTLDTNYHIVLGSGSFVLQDGGAMTIGDPYGITTPFSSVSCPVGADCGSVQTSSRSFSSLADYTYNGFTDQIVGNALPSSVHNLYVVSPPSAVSDTRLDGYSPQTVTGTLQVTGTESGKKEFKGHVTLLKRPTDVCSEIDTYHHVVLAEFSKLTLGCDVVVTGDFTMDSRSSMAGEYLVTMDGDDQTITGSPTFYKLRESPSLPSRPHTLKIVGRVSVTSDLSLHGDATNPLTLTRGGGGGAGGSVGELCALGSRDIDYATVSNIDATCSGAPVTALHSTDGGGNTNVLFDQYMLTVTNSGAGQGVVTSQPQGISCGAQCASPFARGIQPRLVAAALLGSRFVGWSGDCSGTDPVCDLTMDGPRSVTAIWEIATPTNTATPSATATSTSTATATYTPTPEHNTGVGSNVVVQSASLDASVTFTEVTTAGDTTFTPISSGSAGSPPSGYKLCASCQGYDISTTALYTPPATVCLAVPSSISSSTFSSMRMLHGENGVLVDITFSHVSNPDGSRQLCGKTSHFSPFLLAEPATISGTVTYGNAVTGTNPRGVPGVTMNAAGSPSLSDTTISGGTYSLIGFGSGSYTVTPSKSGGVNGAISGFDSAKIAQFATGAITLTSSQQTAADVSGFGGVSSFDASLIARYAAGLGAPMGSSGNWIFSPASRTHSSITSDITGDDYSAILMGDVSGNWGDPSPFRFAYGPEREASIAAANKLAVPGGEVVIPVTLEGAASKGIISYQFDLQYDPSVIQPQENAVDLTDSVSRGFTAVVNTIQPGLLRVVIYGTVPMDENGLLLKLRFTVVGDAGSASPLIWQNVMFNEGDPRVIAADGRVEISTAVAE